MYRGAIFYLDTIASALRETYLNKRRKGKGGRKKYRGDARVKRFRGKSVILYTRKARFVKRKHFSPSRPGAVIITHFTSETAEIEITRPAGDQARGFLWKAFFSLSQRRNVRERERLRDIHFDRCRGSFRSRDCTEFLPRSFVPQNHRTNAFFLSFQRSTCFS